MLTPFHSVSPTPSNSASRTRETSPGNQIRPVEGLPDQNTDRSDSPRMAHPSPAESVRLQYTLTGSSTSSRHKTPVDVHTLRYPF